MFVCRLIYILIDRWLVGMGCEGWLVVSCWIGSVLMDILGSDMVAIVCSCITYYYNYE